MKNNSFIITEEDSTKFNQISGDDMMNIFQDGELKKIDVKGISMINSNTFDFRNIKNYHTVWNLSLSKSFSKSNESTVSKYLALAEKNKQ